MKKEIKELYEKLKGIEYGFVDKNQRIYTGDPYTWDRYFDDKYCLQTPEELETNKFGICWDQVELERKYLKEQNIDADSYYIVAYTDFAKATHTFMVIKSDKYYWLEHAWSTFEGIREYNHLNELLQDVKKEFIKGIEDDSCEVFLYQYKKPQYHLGAQEFMKYCESSKKVDF